MQPATFRAVRRTLFTAARPRPVRAQHARKAFRPFHNSWTKRNAYNAHEEETIVTMNEGSSRWNYFIPFLTLYVMVRIAFNARNRQKEKKENAGQRQEQKAETEKGSNNVKCEECGEEHDENALAFMIPIWYPSKQAPEYYKGTDPEWQTYMKVNNDEELSKSIRHELAEKTKDAIALAPQEVTKTVGQNIKITQWWLDFGFPQEKPPTYARPIIVFDGDQIGYGEQIMSSEDYGKWRLLVYPDTAIKSFWKSTDIFYRLQKVKVKDALGMDLTPKERKLKKIRQFYAAQLEIQRQQKEVDRELGEINQNLREINKRLQSQIDEHKEKEARDKREQKEGSSKENSDTGRNITAATNNIFHPQLPSTGPSDGNNNNNEPWSTRILSMLPQDVPLPTEFFPDVGFASKLFAADFLSKWRAAEQQVSPGSFHVFGQVELQGDEGRLKLSVKALYDPKTREFSHLNLKLDHYWPRVTRPMGGNT